MAGCIVPTSTELSAKVTEKALDELKEKQSEIPANIKSFQRWLSTIKHFTCPKDQEYLIAFLRHAKYEHAKAQSRIDNYCTMAKSEKFGRPSWFVPFKMDDPIYLEYERQKFHVPLGFIGEDGPFVMIIKFGNYNSDKLPQNELWRAITMQSERLTWIPRIQVCGLSVVFDMTGVSTKTLLQFQSLKDQSDSMKYWQDSLPIRTKNLIYYNEPPIFDAMFKVFEQFLNKKMKSRILRCKDNIELAYERLPGLREIMPKEYGGNNKSENELHAECMAAMREYWKDGDRWPVSVDESRRPEKCKLDKSDQLQSMEGTYIKLDEKF